VAQAVRDSGKKVDVGLEKASVITANHFSGVWASHDRRFTTRSGRASREFPRDYTDAFGDPIIDFDFVGDPEDGRQAGSESIAGCGPLPFDRKARLFNARSKVSGDHLDSLGALPFDRLDGKVSLLGMEELIVRELACEQCSVLHEFFAEVEALTGLTH